MNNKKILPTKKRTDLTISKKKIFKLVKESSSSDFIKKEIQILSKR